jgi:hypothetical protein
MQSRQHARFLLFSQNEDHPSSPISLTELSSLELHQRAASWRALQRNPQQTNRLATEPLVRCQLLASEFYEALKRALRAPELSPVERWAVMAAANQCLHAADASISPGTVALELRAAIAMLQFNGTTPPQRSGRPVLRVIEGRLSQA